MMLRRSHPHVGRNSQHGRQGIGILPAGQSKLAVVVDADAPCRRPRGGRAVLKLGHCGHIILREDVGAAGRLLWTLAPETFAPAHKHYHRRNQ
jgi:hypothetical protein